MAHDPYAAFRLPAFRWTFLVHVLSILATQMQSTAFGWLVYERTHAAFALGLTGLSLFLPILLLSLPVGHLVDARSKKAVLLTGQGILILGALAIAAAAPETVPVGFLFLGLILSGVGNAFASIARPALMRDVIPPHQAESTANWSSLGRRIASVAGPLLTGVLIARYGPQHALLTTAALLLVSAVCVLRIRVPASKAKGSRQPMTLQSLTEGISFIRHTPIILSATLLDMCAVLFAGAVGLLPIFAKDILHVGPAGLGLLVASSSLGSGLMSLMLAHRPPLRRAGRSLLWAVAGYGLMTIVFSLSTSVALSLAALFLAGAFDAVSVTVRSTILQVFVPERLRGRVYGVNMIFVYSSNELGDFESGMLASLIGPQASVLIGGLAAMAMAPAFGKIWPQLRELGSLKLRDETPEESVAEDAV
jgi:MFS family permease